MLHKIATKLTVFILFALLLLPVQMSEAFTDTQGHYNEDAIGYLYEKGVVDGYGDGSYAPEGTINRAEFVKILIDSKYPSQGYWTNCFPDVGTDWYAPYVCYAEDLGIIDGYGDGYFRPSNTINLAEALKIVLETYEIEFTQYSDNWLWYAPYQRTADDLDLLYRIDTDIEHKVTRGEMAQFVYNTETYLEETPTYANGKECFLYDSTQSYVYDYWELLENYEYDAFYEDDEVASEEECAEYAEERYEEEEPFVYTPHTESGIYDFTGYSEPERVWMGRGDTMVLENGLTLEIIHSISTSTRFALYYDTDPRLYRPEAYQTLGSVGLTLSFHSRLGVFIYRGDYNEETGESELEIYSNASDFYQRCLSDSENDELLCLTEIGRYDVVHDSYEKMSDGNFEVIYPLELEEMAAQTLEYLPGCYSAVEDLFTVDQAVDGLTVFFYYPEESGQGAYAMSDSIVVPFYEGKWNWLDDDHPSEACGIEVFPMAHEMVHVFDYGTQNTPILREGFANYLSRRVNVFDYELVCESDGYKKHYLDTDTYGELVEYPEDSGDDAYHVGECYFKRLEEGYGIEAVNEVIEYLGTTRNLESTGEEGYAGNVNFFDDVIAPFLGTDAVDLAEEMNIDVTCDYNVPFEGYLCAEHVE